MRGFDLLKELAAIENELGNKLEEARRSAEDRVAKAEEDARRILAGADARIRRMEETLEVRIAEESEKYSRQALAKAVAEGERIRQQADSNIDRAVDFLLSEVIP